MPCSEHLPLSQRHSCELHYLLWLPSPMDVLTWSQAAARESAAEVLRSFRKIATLVWPNHPSAEAAEPAGGAGTGTAVWQRTHADWEVLQAELMGSAPGVLPALCGEELRCFIPACKNLEGPSELLLKTYACSGGCGVRYPGYCSIECQTQGWRDGHRLSCGRLRDGQEGSSLLEWEDAEHCREGGGHSHSRS